MPQSFINQIQKISKMNKQIVKTVYEDLELKPEEREVFERVARELDDKLERYRGEASEEEEPESKKVKLLSENI